MLKICLSNNLITKNLMFNDYILIQKTRELKTGLNKRKSLMIRLCCVVFTVATVFHIINKTQICRNTSKVNTELEPSSKKYRNIEKIRFGSIEKIRNN
jgi:hypothetical protein